MASLGFLVGIHGPWWPLISTTVFISITLYITDTLPSVQNLFLSFCMPLICCALSLRHPPLPSVGFLHLSHVSVL